MNKRTSNKTDIINSEFIDPEGGSRMKTLIFKEGKNEMIVTKDENGDLVSVRNQDGNDIESEEISFLKLADESIKTRGQITNVSNDTVIQTHSSPGCTWYFFRGYWYRICS